MSATPTAPGPETSQVSADLSTWVSYFDDLEAAMHDFEVGLSQQNVMPLRYIETPVGHPPEELRERSGELYLRITELEFRARFLREEIRAESARLPRGRTRGGPKSDWNYGSSLDINT
jgi:hypothetical protein